MAPVTAAVQLLRGERSHPSLGPRAIAFAHDGSWLSPVAGPTCRHADVPDCIGIASASLGWRSAAMMCLGAGAGAGAGADSGRRCPVAWKAAALEFAP
jgi:hypothetical protein